MKDELSALLQKEMSRKDFLKLIGVGIVAMTGLSSLLKALNNMDNDGLQSSLGYGGSPYGGHKKSTKS